MATLLIGNPETTWREWLKANRGQRDLVVLDPAEPTLAPGGQLVHYHGSKPIETRFFGSLDTNRSPHVLVAAAAQFLQTAPPDTIYQLAPYIPSPLHHQTVHLLAHLLLKSAPKEILIAEGTLIEQSGFPVGPTILSLDKAFPNLVQAAQRKAQWLAFFERAESQTLDLTRLAIEGGRLGAGQELPRESLPKGAIYGEKAGPSLFFVAEEPLNDEIISRALDHHHASRAHVVEPADYENLLVGLTRESGEDFALGIIERIDFKAKIIRLKSDAVPPAPAKLLRLGSMRITESGPEPGEPKPWTL